MAFKFFSQRQRGEEVPDVMQYDSLPVEFRNQLSFMLEDIYKSGAADVVEFLVRGYCREKGIKKLSGYDIFYDPGKIHYALNKCIDMFRCGELLDLIDYICAILYREVKQNSAVLNSYPGLLKAIEEAYKELNERFKQHNLGYEVTNGQLVRIDNQVVHAQYVKPALQLLCDEEFAGAEDEYRKAFEARRAGNNKDAILNAGKCFESVLKTICEKKKYSFNPQKDTANTLLNILKTQGFFPEYMESHLNGLITTLQSGVPTVRNKVAGHGQGSEITDAPDCLVDYVLGLVAVNSVLLVKLYKEGN